jgi:hypothetical protein
VEGFCEHGNEPSEFTGVTDRKNIIKMDPEEPEWKGVD